MINKTVFTVIVSIILTILIVSLVNVGLSIFLEPPDYNKFCGSYNSYAVPVLNEKTPTESVCSNDTRTCDDGKVLSRDLQQGCMFPSCDPRFKTCQEESDNAMKDYNQMRYYVFASVGFILLLIGLFIAFNMIQLTGLFSGAILLLEGIIFNFQNKIIVFISLLIIFLIFGIGAWRIINRNKDKK